MDNSSIVGKKKNNYNKINKLDYSLHKPIQPIKKSICKIGFIDIMILSLMLKLFKNIHLKIFVRKNRFYTIFFDFH